MGNFKGGGSKKIGTEPQQVELSSHSGLSLGPHTEAPYWCAVRATENHSPAPSALILSALWNPGLEPTTVIPMPPVLKKLSVVSNLALTSPNFNFTRSDSFVSGKGEAGQKVSILNFDGNLGFTIRFNSYRFSPEKDSPVSAKDAFHELCNGIEDANSYQHVLTQTSAIVINNYRALHCRDTLKDNRRLLVRLFGLSKYSEAIEISADPLILRG